MAPLPPIANIYRAVVNTTYDGQSCANVLHFTHAEIPNPATLSDLGASLVAWWNANLRARVPATVVLRDITLTDLTAGGPPSLIYGTGLPLAGTKAGAGMPNNVTCVFSVRTGIRGRSFRGRIYHVGFAESDILNNSVEVGVQGGFLGAYASLVALDSAALGANYQLGVLSYFANKQLRAVPVFTPAVQITSDFVIDSQRRRLPGRGR